MGNLKDFGPFLAFPDPPGPAVNRCVCKAPLGNKFVCFCVFDPLGQVLRVFAASKVLKNIEILAKSHSKTVKYFLQLLKTFLRTC